MTSLILRCTSTSRQYQIVHELKVFIFILGKKRMFMFDVLWQTFIKLNNAFVYHRSQIAFVITWYLLCDCAKLWCSCLPVCSVLRSREITRTTGETRVLPIFFFSGLVCLNSYGFLSEVTNITLPVCRDLS